jgi:hypothetical protein
MIQEKRIHTLPGAFVNIITPGATRESKEQPAAWEDSHRRQCDRRQSGASSAIYKKTGLVSEKCTLIFTPLILIVAKVVY